MIAVAPLLCVLAAGALSPLLVSGRAAVRRAGFAATTVVVLFSAGWCLAGIGIRLQDTRPAAARFIA